MEQPPPDPFSREASGPRGGSLRELAAFLLQNKKWWLFPILLVLVLTGVMIVLGGSPLAPFLYTVF